MSLSLCPRQINSTTPQCLTLIEKLAELKATLIESSLGEEDESGEVEAEKESLREPLLEGTLALLDAFKDEKIGVNCSPGDVDTLLLNSLREVSLKLPERSYDKHYLILFIFTAIILGLLLLSQTYHCVSKIER